MHISEGVLSGPVLISGGVLAAAGTAIGLKKIDYDHLGRGGSQAYTKALRPVLLFLKTKNKL
jgi:ABC-type Co2+ transport system permease subunit